jgi:group I intron endonuclease
MKCVASKDIYYKKGIYKILNLKSGDCYIGSTTDYIGKRVNCHFNKLKKTEHSSKKMQIDYIFYGKDSFVVILLEECDEACQIKKEQKWIDIIRPEYNTLKRVSTVSRLSSEGKKSVSRSRGGKPIEIYKIGKLLKTYDTIKECLEDHPEMISSGISGVLSGKCKHHKGYRFKYVGEDFKYVNRRIGCQKGKSISKETRTKLSNSLKGREVWNKGKKTGNYHTKESNQKRKLTLARNNNTAGKPPKMILAEKDGFSATFLSMKAFAEFCGCDVSFVSQKHKNNKTWNIKGYKTTLLNK